jgi:hypothetical protein
MICISIQRPLSTRSHRSSSIATDGIRNTPCSRISFSSTQDIPIVDYHKDNRLKRAAAHERRQATRKYWIFDE